jgi:hypothetical protein
MENSVLCNDEWKETLLLKISYIGCPRILEIEKDLPGILEWLCKKFGFSYLIEQVSDFIEPPIYMITLDYSGKIAIKFFLDSNNELSVSAILVPEILKFWKSIDGELFGPRWDIYTSPQEDWT